jgi:hypothetical protein
MNFFFLYLSAKSAPTVANTLRSSFSFIMNMMGNFVGAEPCTLECVNACNAARDNAMNSSNYML